MKTTRVSFHQFEVYKVRTTGSYFFIFMLLTLLFIVYNLENTYRNASNEFRWQIKYLVAGIFTAAFFYIFLISFMLLYKIVRVEYFVAEAIVMILAGLFIAFSLVRHRLINTDVFISRQVIYNSFVIFVTGAYLITIAVIGYLVKYRFIHQEVTQFLVAEIFMYVAVIALILLLLSDHVRRRVERYISKHFYKHKYEYDEVWIAFTRHIGSNISLKALLPQLVHSVLDILNTERVFIFLHDEQHQQIVLHEGSQRLAKDYRIPMTSKLVTYFKQASHPHVDVSIFQNNEELREIYTEQREMFETLEVALCAPLRIEDNFIGILVIGKERTEEPYGDEDYDLLHTIGIQAASAILNARLTENLTQARALETFHKFAAFTLHDLKNAVQNLSLVVQNAPDHLDDPEFREDAIQAISGTVTRMNNLIAKLSSVPEKLAIQLRETQVERFIDDTLTRSKVSKLNHIQVQVELEDSSLSLPMDYHHVQSVLTNLLSNAAESITGAGSILIQTKRRDHTAEISVSDTGNGISPEHLKELFTPFKSTKKKGLGIGLYQCKTIVEAHGGKIYVESDVGQGTVFRVELPLTMKG